MCGLILRSCLFSLSKKFQNYRDSESLQRVKTFDVLILKREKGKEISNIYRFVESQEFDVASEIGIYDVTEFYTAGEYPFGIRSVAAFSKRRNNVTTAADQRHSTFFPIQ